MKKGSIILSIIALVSLSTVHATPVYYTYEGIVDHPNDYSERLVELGINLGDSFTATFMVDRDRQGSVNRDGEVVEAEDITLGNPDSGNYIFKDSFHVELVSSSLFDLVQANRPDQAAGGPPWSGYGYANSFYRDGSLNNGSANFQVNAPSIGVISAYSYQDISLWEAGRSGLPDTTINIFDGGYIHPSMHLASISTCHPASGQGCDSTPTSSHSVPEPSTLMLLIGGLLGMSVRRYKKRGRIITINNL
jgi:hypothetical protein